MRQTTDLRGSDTGKNECRHPRALYFLSPRAASTKRGLYANDCQI
jgi:hypothetical protein